MNCYFVFSLLVCSVSWTIAAPSNLETKKTNATSNKTEEDPLGDDRINLNWGTANAHAIDDKGRYSGVQTNSWGVTAGIKNIYTGQHVSFGSKAGSKSNAYSSGKGAPLTWANSHSAGNHQTATGNAKAGFSGGRGTSHAATHSQTQLYDLGGGNVLYNNLNTKDKEEENDKSDLNETNNKNNSDGLILPDKQESPVAQRPSAKLQSRKKPNLNSELTFN